MLRALRIASGRSLSTDISRPPLSGLGAWPASSQTHFLPLVLSLILFVWSLAVWTITINQRSGLEVYSFALGRCEGMLEAGPVQGAAGVNQPYVGTSSHFSFAQLGRSIDLLGVAISHALLGEAPKAMEPTISQMSATKGKLLEDLRKNQELLQTALKMNGVDYADAFSEASERLPSVTIFTAPRRFSGEDDDPQMLALKSWAALKPPPQVVLVCSPDRREEFSSIARFFPGIVSVESDVDHNFLGEVQFGSLVSLAMLAKTDVSAVVESSTMVLDMYPALMRASNKFPLWFLSGYSTAAPISILEQVNPREVLSKPTLFRQFVDRFGVLDSAGGMAFFAWNNKIAAANGGPLTALVDGTVPPFAVSHGEYDAWFMHEVIATARRAVVDATESISAVHFQVDNKQDGQRLQGKMWWQMALEISGRRVALGTGENSWQGLTNHFLSMAYGSYSTLMGTALHAPWKMAHCDEPLSLNRCFIPRSRPAMCPCEYSSTHNVTTSDPRRTKDKLVCLHLPPPFKVPKIPIVFPGGQSNNANNNNNQPPPGMPHTMNQILPRVARRIGDERVVILVAVNHGYIDMLMSFICGLKPLGLDSMVAVAALDEDIYRFAVTQGLPVYYEAISSDLRNFTREKCEFGSQCFRKFTKLKSRAVLHVLKAGYSVLWTDVDIVWFKDPLPALMSYGPGTFPIQSNEPNATLPGNGMRRINSGFYFARAEPRVVGAFERIVQHTAQTTLSEQPSFYDVLCGDKGELAVAGKEECLFGNGLRTVFLDRRLFANGAAHGYWEQKGVAEACQGKGCYILHNNWIAGRDEKIKRVMAHGLWFYDSPRRMCKHSWTSLLPPTLPLVQINSTIVASQ